MKLFIIDLKIKNNESFFDDIEIKGYIFLTNLIENTPKPIRG